MNYEKLIQNIDKLAKGKGISRTKALMESGVGKNFVNNIEREGGSSPGSKKIQQLADYFNVSTDYLLGNATDGLMENNVVLAEDEQELLNDYRLLNNLGKSEALKRINELTKLEQYNSSDNFEEEIFIPIAARKARTNNRKLKKRNSNIKLSDLPDYKG